jgi:GNAT superfamily N-acetyltransferase
MTSTALSVWPAVPADASAPARLRDGSYRRAYRGLLPEAFLQRFTEEEQQENWRAILFSGAGETVLLATSRTGEVPGYAVIARLPRPMTPGGEGKVVSLHVRFDSQGGGVGKALFEAAHAWLAGEGCRSMMVWLLDGNPATAFDEHLGGAPAGRRVIALGEGEVRAEEVASRWALEAQDTDPAASQGQGTSHPLACRPGPLEGSGCGRTLRSQ